MTKAERREVLARIGTALNARGDYQKLLEALIPLEAFHEKHRRHGQRHVKKDEDENRDIQGTSAPD